MESRVATLSSLKATATTRETELLCARTALNALLRELLAVLPRAHADGPNRAAPLLSQMQKALRQLNVRTRSVSSMPLSTAPTN